MTTAEWVTSKKHEDGRRMVADGAKLMVNGVAETVKHEVKAAVVMSVIGAAWGATKTLWTGTLAENISAEAKKFARAGAIYGWFAASGEHMESPKGKNDQIRLIDWVVAAATSYRSFYKKSPFESMDRPGQIFVTQVANPMTVAGADTILRGAIKMALA